MPGYATGARLAAELAMSQPSCRPPSSPRPSTDCPARTRTGNSWFKAKWDCWFPHGAVIAPPRFERGPPRPGRGALAACATGLIAAKTGPRPPDDGGAHTSDVRTSTASRTRFSELWRRYLLEASLTAVGRRIVLPDSAMPCASWESDSRRRPYMEVSARARSPENRLPLNTKGAVCEKGTVTRPLSLRHHRGTRSHFQKVI